MAFGPEGIAAWSNLFNDWHKQKAARPYIEDLAKANRDTQMSEAEMKQAEAMYAPQYFGARADLTKNQAGLVGEQAKYHGMDISSQANLRGAQAGLAGAETKFMPLKYAIEAANSQRGNERFGGSYQFAKLLSTMDPAQRATVVAQNPAAYMQMVNDLGNKVLDDQKGAGNGKSDFLTSVIQSYFPNPQSQNMPSPQMIQPPSQQMQSPQPGGQLPPNAPLPQTSVSGSPNIGQPMSAPMTAPTQQNTSPMGQPSMASPPENNAPRFSSTPADIEQQKLAAQMVANQKLTTTKTRNQMEGALQVSGIMADPGFKERAESAASYAGAAGKGKAALAALSQQNPKAYEDFKTFKNVDMVLLNNRIKMLDGMGATDAQRAELNGLYTKAMDSLTSNPREFKQQLDNLHKSLDNVAKSVERSASPLFNVDRLQSQANQMSSPSPNNNISAESHPALGQMTTDQLLAIKNRMGE